MKSRDWMDEAMEIRLAFHCDPGKLTWEQYFSCLGKLKDLTPPDPASSTMRGRIEQFARSMTAC